MAALCVAGAALAVLSCQILLGVDEPAGVLRPDADVAAEAASIVDPCAHALPPSPPVKDDDPSKQETFWFAVEELVLPLRPDAGVQPGLDLDRSCTCQHDLFDGAPPCVTPAANAVSCDFEGGVDDSLGRLLQTYAALIPGFNVSKAVNRQISTGERGLLIYVGAYNGKANDQEVQVAFVRSGGLYSDLGCNDQPRPTQSFPSSPGAPGTQRAPVWDGCDRWSPHPGLLLDKRPSRVPVTLKLGYVSNFSLVVEVDQIGLELLGASARAGNAYVVARIVPEETGDPNRRFRLDGFISGRVAFTELEKVVGRSEVRESGELRPLCQSALWPEIGSMLCTARDSMDSRTRDHEGESCNAVTGSFGFTAQQASVSDDDFSNPISLSQCDNVAIECSK